MTTTLITRHNIEVYVERTMPNENLDDFDIPAIAQDVIDMMPAECGDTIRHERGLDGWLDENLGQDAYWAAVAKHDKTAKYECPDCGELHDGMTTGTEKCPGCDQ